MALGNLLVLAGIVISILGIIFSFLRLKTKDVMFTLYSRFTTFFLFILITGLMLWLYWLFISSDVSIAYVWAHTKPTYSIWFRLSGALAGMSGSLLFWIWMIIIPWFYEEVKATRRPADDDLMDWTRIFIFITLAVMLFILSLPMNDVSGIHRLFDLTPPDLLTSISDGYGMAPPLQTGLMVIHPPLIFLAYGFLAVPFASGLAYLITGKKGWTNLSLNWSRAGWLFLTLGLGIGALWAYVDLNFGGYWAWDPVETSSLLPWILLTGFLHVQLMHKRKRDYPILAPVLGALTFLLVLFATFTTRAGGLWVSVHDFGDADTSVSPLTRLTDILSTNDTVLIYFIFMIVIIALTLAFALHRYMKMATKEEVKTYTLSELISDDILMLVTVFIFILVTTVTLAILIMGINGLTAENFNMPIGALVLLSFMVLTTCLIWRNLGRKWIVIISIGTFLASVIGYLLFSNSVVASSLPIVGAALIGTGYKVFDSFNPKKAWRSMRFVSAHLIHFSVVLIVIGYIGSNFMTLESGEIDITVGEAGETVGAYTIIAVDTSVEDGIGIPNLEVDERPYINPYTGLTSIGTQHADIDIMKGENFISRERITNVWGYSYYSDPEGNAQGWQLIRSKVRVANTLTDDIYLSLSSVDETSQTVYLTVKILPLMKFVWGGMWLMSAAIIIRVLVEKTTGKKEPEKYKEKDEIVSSDDEIKTDDYYESLLDEELEMMEMGEEPKIMEMDEEPEI